MTGAKADIRILAGQIMAHKTSIEQLERRLSNVLLDLDGARLTVAQLTIRETQR